MSTDIILSGVGGEYMESATLVEWRAKDGAPISAGDVVAVVETAKAATEIEAPASGMLRIAVPEGTEVAVGATLGRIGDDSDAAAVARSAPEPEAPASLASAMPRRWPPAYASPKAKSLAALRGVDLSDVRGSGPGGRIVSDDLRDPGHGAPAGAPFTLAIDVAAEALMSRRAARWEQGERPDLGTLVAEAASQAIRATPSLPALAVHEGEDGDGLAVLDLSAFGLAAFAPPPLPRARATLGVPDIRLETMLIPRAGGGVSIDSASRLRLSLSADHRRLAYPAAASLLAAIRDALETMPEAEP